MLVNLRAIAHQVTDSELLELSRDNPDSRFERTHLGELIVMPPTGGNSGRRNTSLIFQVELWNSRIKGGITFESSTGFVLSNGAVRSPDVAWIELSRWNELSAYEQERFVPIAPNFEREIRGT